MTPAERTRALVLEAHGYDPDAPLRPCAAIVADLRSVRAKLKRRIARVPKLIGQKRCSAMVGEIESLLELEMVLKTELEMKERDG